VQDIDGAADVIPVIANHPGDGPRGDRQS
jgi:hypothetical protein